MCSLMAMQCKLAEMSHAAAGLRSSQAALHLQSLVMASLLAADHEAQLSHKPA